MSKCRQNYSEACEAGVNKQINLELYASYVYMSMAYHFDRDDVDLKGFFKFFKESSDEEREHAEKLMKFQNQRGGRIVLQDVKTSGQNDWGSGLEAMREALNLEKEVNQSLLNLHSVAEDNNDVQMQDFLEANFLTHQIESIKELAGYVRNLERVGTGLGEFQFDKLTLQDDD